jgi:signal transduction histidine kinase
VSWVIGRWPASAANRIRARARQPRLSLAVQFLLANLAVLLAAMLVLGGWVGNEIEAAVLKRSGAIAALYVGTAVAPFVQRLAYDRWLEESDLASLDDLLSHTPLGEHTVEFRVWNADRTILYSADRTLIGQRLNPDEGFDEALAGDVTAEMSDLQLGEQRNLRARAERLLEVYTPVRENARGRVIGVIEFYEVPDELVDEVASARQRSWAVVAAITLATYLVLAGIVKRGSDTIVRQQRVAQQQLRELRQLADDNARLYAEAQRAIRLRDDFLTVASHELKTPVAALQAFTQLMRSRLKRGQLRHADFGEVLHEIHRHAIRLGRLGSRVLDTSRIDARELVLRREPTELVELVRGAIDSLARDRTIAFTAPKQLIAFVDPVRVEQVVSNVLDNALKFSPNGGAIEVELAEVGSNGGTVRFSVRDYGIGVPKEHRPHLFERFYQAHAGQHFSGVAGLGLGLYISQQIVAMHGGHIVAEFPTGGGTRVSVTLPTHEPPLDSVTPVGAGQAAPFRNAAENVENAWESRWPNFSS